MTDPRDSTASANDLLALAQGTLDALGVDEDDTPPPEEWSSEQWCRSEVEVLRALARNPNSPPELLGRIFWIVPLEVLRHGALPADDRELTRHLTTAVNGEAM